jgi:hypothetical protein
LFIRSLEFSTHTGKLQSITTQHNLAMTVGTTWVQYDSNMSQDHNSAKEYSVGKGDFRAEVRKTLT